MGREAWSALASIATLAILGAAAPAHAATITVSGHAATYTAAEGERNSVGFYIGPGFLHVADSVPIEPGAGCGKSPPKDNRFQALCALPVGEPNIKIRTLDGNDAVIVRPALFPPGAGVTGLTVDGGAGQDTLSVFQDVQGPITLHGGSGADYLSAAGPQLRVAGDSGDDVIFARTTLVAGVFTVAARLTGGSGDDTVAVQPAGPIGARQNSSERLDGGRGDDFLFGNDGTDVIHGGPGADLMGGFKRSGLQKRLRRSKVRRARSSTVFVARSYWPEVGTDVLTGDGGNDRIRGDHGPDVISGGPGNDVINGGRESDLIAGSGGRDTLVGGPGNDIVFGGPGFDALLGQAGTDNLITADDKQRDAGANCGPGRNDRVVGGVSDFSKGFSAHHSFRITNLGKKPGALPGEGYPVPASAIATVPFPAVGARITGCESFAIAP